jgi:hypothetical protein
MLANNPGKSHFGDFVTALIGIPPSSNPVR